MIRDQDGYGRAMEEYLQGGPGSEVIERNDGWVEIVRGAEAYFAEFENWPERQHQASNLAAGRILDVGCGAGRVALHFQELGHPVVGIDLSPRAIAVCRARGVKDARLLSVFRASAALGTFDTIILFGGNFGLLENPEKARRTLRRFYRMTSPQGRILAESRSPYASPTPVHR